MEFTDEGVEIDKPPNGLDELVLEVTGILDEHDIDYAVVSGYVAVLFGRARATEDIDVLVDRFDAATAADLTAALGEAGYWGPAMPLSDLHATLADGLPVRIAEDGHHVPNVELKFPSDAFDRESLTHTVAVHLPDGTLHIGSLELQIAYKLGMGAQKDFEDALYLFEVTGPTLNHERLEEYVTRLEVQAEYERLESAA